MPRQLKFQDQVYNVPDELTDEQAIAVVTGEHQPEPPPTITSGGNKLRKFLLGGDTFTPKPANIPFVSPAVETIGKAANIPDKIRNKDYAGAASDAIRSASTVAGLALGPEAAIAQPVRSAVSLGLGWLGGTGAKAGAKALGATEGEQNLAQDFGTMGLGSAAFLRSPKLSEPIPFKFDDMGTGLGSKTLPRWRANIAVERKGSTKELGGLVGTPVGIGRGVLRNIKEGVSSAWDSIRPRSLNAEQQEAADAFEAVRGKRPEIASPNIPDVNPIPATQTPSGRAPGTGPKPSSLTPEQSATSEAFAKAKVFRQNAPIPATNTPEPVQPIPATSLPSGRAKAITDMTDEDIASLRKQFSEHGRYLKVAGQVNATPEEIAAAKSKFSLFGKHLQKLKNTEK